MKSHHVQKNNNMVLCVELQIIAIVANIVLVTRRRDIIYIELQGHFYVSFFTSLN